MKKRAAEREYVKTRDYITTSLRAAKARRGKTPFSKQEIERQYNVLSALEKTSQYLAIETDVKQILERIAETVGKALGAKYVNFWNYAPDRKGVYIVAAYGMQKQYIEHSRASPMPVGQAWIGRAMKTGQAWATSNVLADPFLPPNWLEPARKQKYHGLLCTPLIRGKKTSGGMCIYYRNVHRFEYFEMSLATIVANQAATAVENARIFGDLEAEREKTLSIVYSLNDGLILYDLKDRITLVNPRAQELLLLDVKDVLGKTVTESIAAGNVYLQNLRRIRQMMQKDYETLEFTTEGPQKVVLGVTQVPVRSADKKKIGTVLILHDVTREKEVEQLKAGFVTVASHQLRTPLAGIKWSLDILRKGERGALSPEQTELAEKAFRTSEHMAALINDLLDASRIEEGRYGYTFETGDVQTLVGKVVSALAPNAQARELNFVFEAPSGTAPPIAFDAAKLELALQNIVDNAIKYTPLHGTVRIKLRRETSSLFIIVEDTGIGIPEQNKKFIFNKFFRGENAIRRQTEGSGLGLYIAKSIVEKHNGSITFESEENKGSIFMIQLPTDPARMPKTALSAPVPTAA